MSIKKGFLALTIVTQACMMPSQPSTSSNIIPAREYSNKIKLESELARARMENNYLKRYPNVKYIKDYPEAYKNELYVEEELRAEDIVTNENTPEIIKEDYSMPTIADLRRDYNGPLSLGDPGLNSSLWQEGRRGNELFRDHRAWQPMDLITIQVNENSQGIKQADTEVKQESTILTGITKLLGFEQDVAKKNPNIALADLPSLINASTTNDYKGEGDTQRRSSLTASISAMVAEILPSGILRIEGEKIIKVNEEEQIIMISGLVRPRDITSNNTVNSAQIAQLRIDYFGKGIIGDVQSEGWLSSIVRKIWPF